MHDHARNTLRSALLLSSASLTLGLATPAAARDETAPAESEVSSVIVTASTVSLLGKGVTSSQGLVTRQELDLRPVYRVGQLLETIPGLVVTAHSGEGKANQYLVRGFNLDHGTDLASFIDGMPVNMRTHGHGQGYTDLNYMIPELAGGIAFTKGPYFAAEGDFAAVAAYHVDYLNTIQGQISVSAGTVGDRRLFAADSFTVGKGRVLAAGERVALDGPWTRPDDLRKTNLVLRYSEGEASEGRSLTAMYYRGLWNATTDQPQRAITRGLIGRFGTLDPSDAGQAERFSVSGRYAHGTETWRIDANAYVIRAQMTLWNNFTHVLDDPINGDQHGQNDRRTIVGGTARYTLLGVVLGARSETSLGVQGRYDDIYVDRRHTRARQSLSRDNADLVEEGSLGIYAESTLYWTPWLRTTTGLRADRFAVDGRDLVLDEHRSRDRAMIQPKASLALGPWARTEFYLSAGKGFHSNDARGVLQDESAPFLVASRSQELGVRSNLIPHLQASVTLFEITFDSELTYDADAGATGAGPASRRRGVEFSAQYRPFPWIEISSNLALTHSRYTGVAADEVHIPDAPRLVGSLGVIVDNLGRFSGGLEYRHLGAHALVEDNGVRSAGYAEWNANLGFKLSPRLKVRVDVFNVLNSRDNAAEYHYADRLPGEPDGGVEDLHVHPLEPRSARLTLTRVF